MNKSSIYMLIISLCLVSIGMEAQDLMFFKRAKVHIISDYNGSEVKLRIAPGNIETWNYGIEHGYKIERLTKTLNGSSLSNEEVLASKIVVIDNLKPIPEADWDGIIQNNDDVATVAKAMLYEEDFKVLDVNIVDFENAYNVDSKMENRYSFGLFAAEQSYDVALNMGLGYTDINILSNSEYIDFICRNVSFAISSFFRAYKS